MPVVFIIINLIIFGCMLGGFVYVFILVVKALRGYIKASDARKEQILIRMSLGEILKKYRVQCKMTQEFVAENLGVSRQAVSKWENGVSEPSTSNLIALAKLFGVSADELLKSIE